ncbi:hypothetical protein GCM10028778_08120 [Barrientosiimonas marina]
MIKSNLKELLHSRDISIREFSRRIGYRYESVRQLYQGNNDRIPVPLVERICKELNCDVGDLFTYIPS